MAISAGIRRTSGNVRRKDLPAPRITRGSWVVRSELWFVDGNIILLAGETAFRVHRGQLERQSDVFRDLFTLPPPRDGDLLYGCAYVEIYDSPDDVLRLLRAVYDGLYFKFNVFHPEDFITISAVLRLSQKYFIQHLREQSLGYLEHEWPATLTEWDERERRATDHAGHYSPRKHYTHPVFVIKLARELALDQFLPAAFFDICRYGPSKIAAGAPPSTHSAPEHEDTTPDGPTLGGRAEVAYLSEADLCNTLRGREAAQRFIASFIEENLAGRSISEACLNRDEDNGRACRESFYFIMLNVMRSVGGIACGRDADPLYTLLQAREMLDRTDFSDGVRTCGLMICQACKEDFSTAVRRARERVWESIPAWFGLNTSDHR